VKQIRSQVENTTSDYDKEKLQERLAKLVGGVAVIKVGAATETELKEKRPVSKTLCTPPARCREGNRPRRRLALLRCIAAVEKLKLHDDEAVGAGIVAARSRRAFPPDSPQRRPRRRRCDRQDPRLQEENFGFNAETGEYGDMVKMGVIDPAKVTRLARRTQRPSRDSCSPPKPSLLTSRKMIRRRPLAGAPGAGGMGGMY